MAEESRAPDIPAESPAGPPVHPRPLIIRLFWRMLYMASTAAFVGACLGFLPGFLFGGLAQGIAWAIVGAVLGAILGVFAGLTVAPLAWVFDGPRKGALRAGALMALLMGTVVFVALLSAQDRSGIGNALLIAVLATLMGGVSGAALGGFLGWVAGPIFRGMVQELEEKAGPTKR